MLHLPVDHAQETLDIVPNIAAGYVADDGLTVTGAAAPAQVQHDP